MVGLAPPDGPRRSSVLLLEDDEELSDLFAAALESDGFEVDVVRDGRAALAFLGTALPDLIVSDIMMPGMDGLEFLGRLRAEHDLRHLPVILLTTRGRIDDVVAGFDLGADDYLTKPVDLRELMVRARAKVDRPPVPLDLLPHDRPTGVLSPRAFLEATAAELRRAELGGYPCTLAALRLYEAGWVRERLGHRVESELQLAVARALAAELRPLDLVGRAGDGGFLVLMPDEARATAEPRLARLAASLVRQAFAARGETLRVTPLCGFAESLPDLAATELAGRATLALGHAAEHLDLRPIAFDPRMRRAAPARAPRAPALAAGLERLRLPLQIAATYVLGWGLPFAAYAGLAALGLDVSWPVYVAVVAALTLTAALIWTEGLLSRARRDPPELPDAAFGPVSAVIAAYLPNEAATIEATIEAFLAVDYPGPVQIVLAYNTPRPMPVEDRLRALALADRRFVALRVDGSTSKAQNVNAALSIVTGDVTAIYDADHHPDPDSFRRAWRWIMDGADVVQGHCVIRNGDASWVARTVAIEFEQIYAVSHPGRARLHGFGLFGGSNGFWRTSLLREIRMRGSMLTEDIDSALRTAASGRRLVSDPHLVSRELSPTTLSGLTHQRLRWAQGWYQVAKSRAWPSVRSPHLSWRQKAGMIHLLAWREAFPWLSMQVVPIIAWWAWREGGLGALDWTVPLLLFLTLFIAVTGPGQILFTWRNADPSLRARPAWFWSYVLVSIAFYAGYKNVLARVANIKEWMGEKAWKVTPRA